MKTAAQSLEAHGSNLPVPVATCTMQQINMGLHALTEAGKQFSTQLRVIPGGGGKVRIEIAIIDCHHLPGISAALVKAGFKTGILGDITRQ